MRSLALTACRLALALVLVAAGIPCGGAAWGRGSAHPPVADDTSDHAAHAQPTEASPHAHCGDAARVRTWDAPCPCGCQDAAGGASFDLGRLARGDAPRLVPRPSREAGWPSPAQAAPARFPDPPDAVPRAPRR